MKLFKEFIREQRVTTAESGYTVQPKNKEELSRVIWDTIKKEGLDCDLNFIDTSLITDMSHLFAHTRFNGKIDKWDVSNVKYMDFMFEDSLFNRDIDNWDVSNVEMMRFMFYNSKFNKDISEWEVSDDVYMNNMFKGSDLEKNGSLPKWYRYH